MKEKVLESLKETNGLAVEDFFNNHTDVTAIYIGDSKWYLDGKPCNVECVIKSAKLTLKKASVKTIKAVLKDLSV